MSPLQSPDGAYEARGATPADLPAMLHVLEAAFPDWPPVALTGSTADHLAWKFDSPWLTPEKHTVVTHGDEVVAVKLRWASPSTFLGGESVTDHGVDFAVVPSHQRRGLGRLMVDREAADGIHIGKIGFDFYSKHEAVARVHSDVEYVLRDIRTWARPLSARARLGQLRRSGPRHLGGALARTPARAGSPPDGVTIEEIASFDERADALWAAVAPHYAFARARSARYLNWRHADPRSGTRTIFGAFKDGQLFAWAVLRPRDGAVSIADLVVHPDHDTSGGALLDHCVAHAAGQSAARITTWLPDGHPAEAMLQAAGFAPLGDPLVCRFWGMSYLNVPYSFVQPLEAPAQLHVSMGDFDFV